MTTMDKVTVTSIIFVFLSHLAPADQPDWLKEVNVPPNATIKKIPATKLTYSATWNGRVKAGSFKLIFGQKDPRYPKHYLVRSYGGSTGWAHALFPYQYNYTGFLHPRTRRTLLFAGTEKDRKEVDTLNFLFNKNGVSGTEIDLENGRKTVKKSEFKYPNSLGLFSGFLQIRSLKLKKNDKIVIPLHPVSSPYLCRINVLGRENHLGRKCIKLDVALQKIDKNMKLKKYKKLKSSTVWISDDAWRIPIEIRAKVWVGNVRIFLSKHENLVQ